MRRFYRKATEYIPIFAWVTFFFAIISAVLFAIIINSVSFADTFNYHISMPIRMIMAWVTAWIPFSTAELFVITSPIWLILFIHLAFKCAKRGKKASVRFLCGVLSVVCFIFITFVWTYSSGFHTTTIDKKMELETEKLSKEDLYNASCEIIDNLNVLSKNIKYDETGASLMPYSYEELSEKICLAYDKFDEKYGVLQNFDSKIKPIMLSEPMTYTHISGIYSFMTGEANVNVNYPDFIITSAAAHELSHQRGIARENESNFVAFVVLAESEDAFLKYSGYLDIYSDILGALYSVDKDLYFEAIGKLDRCVANDLISYSKFFDKYRDSKASEVSDKINDSYLQANGQQAGTKSYGMIVDVVCAYLKKY